MKNHKQLLADFYLALLSIRHEPNFDLQWLADHVKIALSDRLVEHPDTIERIFERMAEEDVKNI